MTRSYDPTLTSLLGQPSSKYSSTRYKMLEPPVMVVLSFPPLLVGSSPVALFLKEQEGEKQTRSLDLSLSGHIPQLYKHHNVMLT